MSPVVSPELASGSKPLEAELASELPYQWVWQSQLRIAAELDGTGATISRFVYGTKVNVPEFVIRGGRTYRILTDHLGSVRAVVDSADGTIAEALEYDEFGVVLSDSNPGFVPFGFAGGLYDADTGLVRFGARDFEARIGRWTSRDPIRFRGGLNTYAYALGEPANSHDPTGLKIFGPGGRPLSTAEAAAIARLKRNDDIGEIVRDLDARSDVEIEIFPSGDPITRANGGARTNPGWNRVENGFCGPTVIQQFKIRYDLKFAQDTLRLNENLNDTTLADLLAHELGEALADIDANYVGLGQEDENLAHNLGIAFENASRATRSNVGQRKFAK